jgi:hypothetical protein
MSTNSWYRLANTQGIKHEYWIATLGSLLHSKSLFCIYKAYHLTKAASKSKSKSWRYRQYGNKITISKALKPIHELYFSIQSQISKNLRLQLPTIQIAPKNPQ